jgi:hypothetical protein
VVEVVRGVGVVEALGESVDEDTRVRSANNDLWVGAVSVVERKEAGSQRTLTLIDRARACSAVADVGLHGSNANNTEEATASLEETEHNNGSRHGDRGVDTVLDRAEDGNKNTGEEDDNLDGRDAPELVDDLGRSDDISDSVDDDTGKTCIRDVEEDGSKGVESKQDDNSSNDTSEGSSDTSLGLDGSSGERSSSGVSSKEGTEKVADTNGDEFLRGVDNVVVDTTERLGDGDVLNQDNDDGGGKLGDERLDDGGVDLGDSSVSET